MEKCVKFSFARHRVRQNSYARRPVDFEPYTVQSIRFAVQRLGRQVVMATRLSEKRWYKKPAVITEESKQSEWDAKEFGDITWRLQRQ